MPSPSRETGSTSAAAVAAAVVAIENPTPCAARQQVSTTGPRVKAGRMVAATRIARPQTMKRERP